MSISEEYCEGNENGEKPTDPRKADLEVLLYTAVFGSLAASLGNTLRKHETLISSFGDYIALAFVYLLTVRAGLGFGRRFLNPERGVWSWKNLVILLLSCMIIPVTVAFYRVIKSKLVDI